MKKSIHNLIPILCTTAILTTAAWWIRSRHHLDHFSFHAHGKAFTIESYDGKARAYMNSDIWQTGYGYWQESDEDQGGAEQCEGEWEQFEDRGHTWFIGHTVHFSYAGIEEYDLVAVPIWSIMIAAFLPLAAMYTMRFHRRRKNTRRGFAVLLK